MTCPQSDQPFQCPTKWQIFLQMLALLPSGRAWQTHSGTVESDVLSDAVSEADKIGGLTVMQRYWAAFSEVSEWLHQRACALLDEAFCATRNELDNEWASEFAFPDPCEPYFDLCDKMLALFDGRCESFVEIAAAHGWAIECLSCEVADAGGLGCGWSLGDGTALGCDYCAPGDLFIAVKPSESPAYDYNTGTALGCGWALGDTRKLGCNGNLYEMRCLIERFAPAHVRVIYLIAEEE